MASDNHLYPSHYDSDSGADSDVPGSLPQQKKMNDAHARSLAHRLPDRRGNYAIEANAQSTKSKFETTFDAQDQDSVTTTIQGGPFTTAKDVQPYLNGRSSFPAMNSGKDTILTDAKETLTLRNNHRTASQIWSGGEVSYIPQQHKRSKSDGGTEMLKKIHTFSVQEAISFEGDCMVFCEPVSQKLLCVICKKVFKEPAITSCGHTFCRQCVLSMPNARCPTDGTALVVVVANLAVSEQIGELFIHCKYGCTPSSSGIPGEYEVKRSGCPLTLKISSRKEHESTCQYAPVRCPNSSLCPVLVKMELNDHLAHCQHARCPHARFSCKFEGTSEELVEHLTHCRFESMKDFLEHTEGQMQELRNLVARKDQENDYIRGMFSKLTEKIERLEKAVEIRIDLLDENLTKLSSDFIETRRCLGHIEKEISSMDSRQFNLGAFDVQSVLKCKGTFVGHQGPVWSLCVYSSLLFSGSSDNSIKVWDTRSNYKCINTFNDHSGMVLALCAYRGKLYSGSADCTISIFDIENQKMTQNFIADANPICTLAVGNGMLFSGSLKSIKAWELESLKFVRELGGLNHWIRALCTTENFLYCGSYQTIKIWDLKTLEQARVIQTPGGSVYSLVVSREYIVCGTYENVIHVWDVKTYKSVARLTGHSGTVYDLVLMTLVDTNRVISASYDGSLRVWSLDNMQCVQTLFRHQGSVTTLAVSRGRLFSGSVDSTVKVWS